MYTTRTNNGLWIARPNRTDGAGKMHGTSSMVNGMVRQDEICKFTACKEKILMIKRNKFYFY
jgi:hypothetical protein